MIQQIHEVGEVMTLLDVASRLDLELYATSSGTVIPHEQPREGYARGSGTGVGIHGQRVWAS